MTLSPGDRIGSHEIIGPLGAGGMGEVYLARDLRLDREVALKLLPPRMAHDAEAIAWFRREALTLASINHPNIATIYGFEEPADGHPALVLERVVGETLSQRLERGPIPVEEALHACAQVAGALEAAHERGVIHRDVKPGNVMIGPRGLIKVLDFGIARRTPVSVAVDEDADAAGEPRPLAGGSSEDVHTSSDTISGPGLLVGTPGYMSPEQVLGQELDSRADVFAFGCVLYECLAGSRAFPGGDLRDVLPAVLGRPVDASRLPATVPARVRTLIQRCLEKDPAQRLRDIGEARIELEDTLGIRRASDLREAGAAIAHNLPVAATRFVGRTTELAECARALDNTRALTLVGLGGSGKTRLALQLAEQRLTDFPGGVCFVDVAPLIESERLVEALASALGVYEEPGRTLLDGVTATLASRRALVLLDNCETHPEACHRLASHLLGACRELKLLLTSREPLRIAGETLYAVPPLAAPGAGVSTSEAAGDSDAVQLFVERARAANPEFRLTDANAAVVAEICRRLDGIPLAIELAAARVRMLGVAQIRARLEDRFKLLTRGSGASPRQSTVLEMVQWSWDQLLPPEQELMRRLAVFAGGWSLERATTVCSDTGDEFDVLDLLTRLVDRSLVVVQRDETGNSRYRFLETVWRFALAKLEAHPEHAGIRERHLAAYLDFAQRLEPALRGPGMEQAIAELDHEEENVLGAHAWCAHAVDGARRDLRLVGSLHRYWSVLGRYAVGRRVLAEALERDAGTPPSSERAQALARSAGFAVTVGDYAAARGCLEESIVQCRALGDRKGIARSLAGLSVVAMTELRLDEAIASSRQAQEIYAELGEPRGVAMALHNIGSMEWALGRGDHGCANFESALALLRPMGDRSTEALCLAALASSLIRLGRSPEAAQRLRECLALHATLSMPREAVTALEAVAEWRLALGRHAEAALLFAASEAARASLSILYMAHERSDIDRMMARIQEALGDAQARRYRDAGGALSLEQAMAEASSLVHS